MQSPHKRPIVIVEDDDGMRRALVRLLRAAGYSTEAFASAEALFEARDADRAACLVVDVGLPGLSGFELRARLAEAGNSPPFVFISARDESSILEEARCAGAFAYLRKPFVAKDLLGAVARACAS